MFFCVAPFEVDVFIQIVYILILIIILLSRIVLDPHAAQDRWILVGDLSALSFSVYTLQHELNS